VEAAVEGGVIGSTGTGSDPSANRCEIPLGGVMAAGPLANGGDGLHAIADIGFPEQACGPLPVEGQVGVTAAGAVIYVDRDRASVMELVPNAPSKDDNGIWTYPGSSFDDDIVLIDQPCGADPLSTGEPIDPRFFLLQADGPGIAYRCPQGGPWKDQDGEIIEFLPETIGYSWGYGGHFLMADPGEAAMLTVYSDDAEPTEPLLIPGSLQPYDMGSVYPHAGGFWIAGNTDAEPTRIDVAFDGAGSMTAVPTPSAELQSSEPYIFTFDEGGTMFIRIARLDGGGDAYEWLLPGSPTASLGPTAQGIDNYLSMNAPILNMNPYVTMR
jgi:hypothetical protein